MERLPKKRTLIIGVAIFFCLSLGAVLMRSEKVNAGYLSPESDESLSVDSIIGAEEAWRPKAFDPPSDAVAKAVAANVKKSKSNNVLLTAVANNGMADYTLNWIESLKRCKLDDKYLVFAIDQALVDTMTKNGYGDHVIMIPEDWFHQKLDDKFAKWQDKSYTPITHSKTLVVERLLYMDITVWFSDVDIVFMSPEIYNYLIFKLSSRKTTEALYSQETEQHIINSGFYVMRPTDLNKKVLHDSIVIQDHRPDVTQQGAINMVLDEINLSYHSSPIALLDLALFPQGRLYFERNIPVKYGFQPMIVHANYRIGEEKKKSLQDAKLWYID